MLDGARGLISGVITIAVLLGILFIIGVVTVHPSPHGMAAVGDGVIAVFHAIGSLFSSIMSAA